VAENLVIVESPAKARTIKKYLGKDYEVLASYGHVRDLVPKEGAVDPDNEFAMQYRLIERNEKHIAAISKALKKSSTLVLATDPDREGEAIAWHLNEILKERGELKGKASQRVVFHEITKNAIREAVNHPRELSPHRLDVREVGHHPHTDDRVHAAVLEAERLLEVCGRERVIRSAPPSELE